jgi:hypothetical protein
MQVMTLKTNIRHDGHLSLDIPTTLSPGEVELVLVVNNLPKESPQRLSSIIGTAKGCYASPAEADAFINRERDSWG